MVGLSAAISIMNFWLKSFEKVADLQLSNIIQIGPRGT